MDRQPRRTGPAELAALALVPLFLLWLHAQLFPTALAHTSYGDPDYGYLLNSLLIVNGKTPVHFDHPGTMVQLLGAAVIRLRYSLGNSSLDVIDDVLAHPYEVSRAISDTLLGVLCLSTFLFGLALRRSGLPLAAALAGETAPLWLPDTWTYLVHLSPEVLTPAYAMGLALLLVRTQSRPPRPWEGREGLALGALLGASLALKMTFAPLVLLLFLPGLGRARWLAFAAVVPAFALLTLPIWSQYPRLFQWLAGIALHREVYGLGDSGVVPTAATLAGNFRFLWLEAWPFFLLLALLPLATAVEIFGYRKADRHLLPALTLTSLVVAAQVLLVVKQVAPRYLLPSLAVWAWLVPSFLGRLRALPKPGAGLVAAATVAITVGAATAGWNKIQLLRQGRESADALSVEFLTRLDSYRDCLVIFAPPLPKKEFALYSGDLAAGGTFTPRLQAMYPQTIFYDIYPGWFRSFAREVSLENVKDLAAKRPCAVVAGSTNIRQSQQSFLAGAKVVLLDPVKLPFQLEPLFEKNVFGIYRITRFEK